MSHILFVILFYSNLSYKTLLFQPWSSLFQQHYCFIIKSFLFYIHENASAQCLHSLNTVCHGALCFMTGCKFPTRHCNPVCQTPMIFFVCAWAYSQVKFHLQSPSHLCRYISVLKLWSLWSVLIGHFTDDSRLYLVKKNRWRHLPITNSLGELKFIVTCQCLCCLTHMNGYNKIWFGFQHSLTCIISCPFGHVSLTQKIFNLGETLLVYVEYES